ncbi:specifically androgen-regulated gene protein [Gouania willdenowi]|uniref:Specifically androgen-regulated gene protein-like n=1 Tax=Gouania willdenowi TaxID=441366 RepID=A0A8C5NGT8_GOUWI|nr:specifically androgen-regulated gene protein-like [Gouania willdenowi]
MNSAGSCDSVISMNSGYSEDSMEHLSPEERACLMYLEETIEALEVQEDSGFSNDEPEFREQMTVNDYSGLSNESGSDQRSFVNHEGFAPFSHSAVEPAFAESTFANLNPTSEPKDTSNTRGLTVEPLISPTTSTAALETLSSDPKMDAGLIPPPSDFMDNLNSDSRLEKRPIKYVPPSFPAITRPGQTVDVEQLRQRAISPTVNVEQLRQRAHSRKTSLSPPSHEGFHSRSPSDVSSIFSGLSVSTTNSNRSSPLMSRTSLTPSPSRSPSLEPRNPPAVAPKPKVFPTNILMKYPKAAEAEMDGNSTTSSSEREASDHQKVHTEALRKLGLLRSFEEDLRPRLRPKFSPKTRYSWAAPSIPVSPVVSAHGLLKSSHSSVNAFPHLASSSTAAVSPSAPSSVQTLPLPDILPAPAAFSDPIDPLRSDKKSSHVNDFPSSLISRLPRNDGVKSATLERSGVGLSSYMNSRNSREFGQKISSDYEEDMQVSDAASTNSEGQWLSPAHDAPHLQDLPQSHGVSVVISPHAENENDRREALKKLGLLRD